MKSETDKSPRNETLQPSCTDRFTSSQRVFYILLSVLRPQSAKKPRTAKHTQSLTPDWSLTSFFYTIFKSFHDRNTPGEDDKYKIQMQPSLISPLSMVGPCRDLGCSVAGKKSIEQGGEILDGCICSSIFGVWYAMLCFTFKIAKVLLKKQTNININIIYSFYFGSH